jgi:hypothetical protein
MFFALCSKMIIKMLMSFCALSQRSDVPQSFRSMSLKLDVVMKVRMCLVYEASPFSTSLLSIVFRSLDFTKTVTNASM